MFVTWIMKSRKQAGHGKVRVKVSGIYGSRRPQGFRHESISIPLLGTVFEVVEIGEGVTKVKVGTSVQVPTAMHEL